MGNAEHFSVERSNLDNLEGTTKFFINAITHNSSSGDQPEKGAETKVQKSIFQHLSHKFFI